LQRLKVMLSRILKRLFTHGTAKRIAFDSRESSVHLTGNGAHGIQEEATGCGGLGSQAFQSENRDEWMNVTGVYFQSKNVVKLVTTRARAPQRLTDAASHFRKGPLNGYRLGHPSRYHRHQRQRAMPWKARLGGRHLHQQAYAGGRGVAMADRHTRLRIVCSENTQFQDFRRIYVSKHGKSDRL
jgi:hypothetical protein